LQGAAASTSCGKIFADHQIFNQFFLTLDWQTIKLDKDNYRWAKGCPLVVFYIATGMIEK